LDYPKDVSEIAPGVKPNAIFVMTHVLKFPVPFPYLDFMLFNSEDASTKMYLKGYEPL
jgi:hypothetical protein